MPTTRLALDLLAENQAGAAVVVNEGLSAIDAAGIWQDSKTGAAVAGSATVTYAAQAVDSTVIYWTRDTSPNSGLRGLHIQKKSDNAQPVGMTLEWDTAALWDTTAIDAATRDLVLGFDHSANAGAGADVFRWSQEQDSQIPSGESTATPTPKVVLGRIGGTLRSNNVFMLVNGGSDTVSLGGVRIRQWGSSHNALELQQRDTAHNRAMLSWGDTTESMWLAGTDVAASGTGTNKNWYLYDEVNDRIRMTAINQSGVLGKIGVNTSNPVGLFAVTGSTDASVNNARQYLFTGSTGHNAATRAVNIMTIINSGSTGKQFIFLNGHLGAASTHATPVASSVNQSHGLESTDSLFSVFVASTGSDQTIQRVISLDYSGAPRLGFFNTAPVVQQAGASAAAIAAVTDGNAQSAISALQNALAAYGLVTAPA